MKYNQMSWRQFRDRHPADVTFSGYGVFDMFQVGGRLVGQVAMDLSRPPFAFTGDPDCKFAPGYRFWPRGLVEVESYHETVFSFDELVEVLGDKTPG